MLSSIRRYYDANTRLFLRFGSSQETPTIHRALWFDGITTLAEALAASHALILSEAQTLGSSLQIMDLGCGVGATLFALLSSLPGALGYGLTLSPLQARYAARHAPTTAHILEADFHYLPLAGGFTLAYAIESFVHALHPDQFLAEAARLLVPGGRLIIIDDFRGTHESHWRAVYQQGWHAVNVRAVSEIEAAAAVHGLIPTLDRDLTPYLHLRDLPDPLARLLLSIGRVFIRAHPIVASMLGSMALQQSLRLGAVEYRMLVFHKSHLSKGERGGDKG